MAETLLVGGPRGVDEMRFDEALVGLCAGLLLGCVLWLALTTSAAVVAQVAGELAPGRPWTVMLAGVVDRGCPALVGRLVAGALGVAVTAALAAPAHAVESHQVRGLALPDRVSGSAWTTMAPRTLASQATTAPRTGAPLAGRARQAVVVVRPGQSLWSIATGLLPRSATDADITRAWHRLHQANESRIGSDPDLILPGTPLVVPDLSTAPR